MNDTFEMGQNGSHSCRSGDAGAVATTTSASAAEQAMISTLTGRKIGQVERVDKTCFGDEAPEAARSSAARVDAIERRSNVFTFSMALADGTPADPPTFVSSIPSWSVGDEVIVGALRDHRDRVRRGRRRDHVDGRACLKRTLGD